MQRKFETDSEQLERLLELLRPTEARLKRFAAVLAAILLRNGRVCDVNHEGGVEQFLVGPWHPGFADTLTLRVPVNSIPTDLKVGIIPVEFHAQIRDCIMEKRARALENKNPVQDSSRKWRWEAPIYNDGSFEFLYIEGISKQGNFTVGPIRSIM
ncbi:hypothetical protein F5X97DRAFT_195098 [Nemania serpens]|nr:hypothetical protein F5X97DRAFT_195098 [Nemania serpens]